MTFDEFIKKHCKAYGGNWAAMLMHGIKAAFPDVYDEMEDRTYEFIELLGILQNKCGVILPE